MECSPQSKPLADCNQTLRRAFWRTARDGFRPGNMLGVTGDEGVVRTAKWHPHKIGVGDLFFAGG